MQIGSLTLTELRSDLTQILIQVRLAVADGDPVKFATWLDNGGMETLCETTSLSEDVIQLHVNHMDDERPRGGNHHYLGGEDSGENPERVVDLTKDPDPFVNIWGCTKVTTVTGFQEQVTRIDLRNARSLMQLGSLPADLELLDLTGCESLKFLPLDTALPKLKYLYLGGCTALQNIEEFLKTCVAGDHLRELDLFQCPGLVDLSVLNQRSLPHLEQLDLQGCENLEFLPEWKAWPKLSHINVQGCEGVQTLPELPVHLQYLRLNGCNNLVGYAGYSINPRERGGLNENVADFFMYRTLCKKAGDPKFSPRAKVILLGDGRAGKTTLAKAMVWRDLGKAGRDKLDEDAREEMEPSDQEVFTHAVNLKQWLPSLNLPGQGNGLHECDIRIWDFGGQDIYHGTHRTFAASGALFVVVIKPADLSLDDPPEDLGETVWKDMNRPTDPAYWLEYIRDLNPDAKVLLVHPRAAKKVGRGTQSGKADEGDNAEVLPDLPEELKPMVQHEFFLNSLEWGDERFAGFMKTLEEKLAATVLDEGVYNTPVESELIEWITQVRSDQPFCSAADWDDKITEIVARHNLELTKRHRAALTRNLHRGGNLFQLEGNGHILLDQRRALGLIYDILDPTKSTFCKISMKKQGYFQREVLRDALLEWEAKRQPGARPETLDAEDLSNHTFTPEETHLVDQVMLFMRDCQIVIPIFQPTDPGVAGEPWQGLSPVLLPEWTDTVRDGQNDEWVRECPSEKKPFKRESFELSRKAGKLFSREDFTTLMAYAVKRFRNRVECWKECFECVWSNREDEWYAMRFQWRGDAKAYGGCLAITVAVLTDDKGTEMLGRAMDLFLGDNSPFPHTGWVAGSEPVPTQGPERHDVGICYRSNQRSLAIGIKRWCERKGIPGATTLRLKCYIYEEDQKTGSRAEVRKALQDSRLTLLILSRQFLSESVKNEYTQKELVESIITWETDGSVGVVHLEGDRRFSLNRNLKEHVLAAIVSLQGQDQERDRRISNCDVGNDSPKDWVTRGNEAREHYIAFAKCFAKGVNGPPEGPVKISFPYYNEKGLWFKLRKWILIRVRYWLENEKSPEAHKVFPKRQWEKFEEALERQIFTFLYPGNDT